MAATAADVILERLLLARLRYHSPHSAMPHRTVSEVIDREYLELRAKVLEIAASFDRMERAEGQRDERMLKIEAGLQILSDSAQDKAKRVQELFSIDYDSQWRERFGINK